MRVSLKSVRVVLYTFRELYESSGCWYLLVCLTCIERSLWELRKVTSNRRKKSKFERNVFFKSLFYAVSTLYLYYTFVLKGFAYITLQSILHFTHASTCAVIKCVRVCVLRVAPGANGSCGVAGWRHHHQDRKWLEETQHSLALPGKIAQH